MAAQRMISCENGFYGRENGDSHKLGQNPKMCEITQALSPSSFSLSTHNPARLGTALTSVLFRNKPEKKLPF
jgi:hypothetical protein